MSELGSLTSLQRIIEKQSIRNSHEDTSKRKRLPLSGQNRPSREIQVDSDLAHRRPNSQSLGKTRSYPNTRILSFWIQCLQIHQRKRRIPPRGWPGWREGRWPTRRAARKSRFGRRVGFLCIEKSSGVKSQLLLVRLWIYLTSMICRRLWLNTTTITCENGVLTSNSHNIVHVKHESPFVSESRTCSTVTRYLC